MAISHVYSNAVPDGTATSVVRPSDWNSAHNLFQQLTGNTSGLSSVSGTNIVFAGGTNITLAGTTAAGAATVSFIGPDLTPYLTTAMRSDASSTLGATGFTTTTAVGVVVAGTNDTSGLKLAVPAYITTYAAQTNQTVASGNIAGTGFTSTTTAGTAIVGTNSTNGLSLGVPLFLTTQSVQTQASGAIAGTGFTSAGANISLSGTLNTAGLSLSASVAAPGGGGGFTGGVSTGGNTVGNTGTQTGQFVLAGGNNITLSVATAAGGAQTITISGANAGGAQTGISGVQVSNTTYTSGTITFQNANGISFGSSGANGISASYTVPSTAGLISTAPFIGVSNTGNTAGNTTVFSNSTQIIAGSGSITISQSTAAGGATAWIQHPAWITTARASNDAIGLNTALTANGVSVTANSSGLSLNFPAFLTTAAQSSVSNVSGVLAATNNTGGGTATLSGNISFSNANSMTFYTSAGNAIVGSFSTSQSVQTQASGNIARTGVTTGATAGSVLAATLDTGGLSLGVPAWITTTPAQTNQTGNFYVTANSTQLSSTAAIDLRSVSFAGAGIASVGVSNGVVLVSVPAGGGGGDGYNIVSMLTSTSGGGTAGATFSALSGSVGLMAGSNITLSQTSNTIVINGPAAGGGGTTQSWWQPEVWGSLASTTFANGTVYLRPFELDAPTDADMMILQQSISSQASSTLSFSASVSAGNASSGSGTYGQTMTALWFSRVNTNETNASYNSIISFDSKTYSLGQGYSASVSWSTNASSATASVTTSWAVSYINNIDSAGNITTASTGTTGSTSFSSTSTNANSFSSSFVLSAPYAHVSGIRPIYFPQAGSNVAGGEYWLGLIQSTNTGSTNMSLQRPLSYATQGIIAFTGSTQNSFLEYGNSNNLSTSNIRPGYGSYSASSNTTAAIPLSQVSILGSNASVWFAIAGRTK